MAERPTEVTHVSHDAWVAYLDILGYRQRVLEVTREGAAEALDDTVATLRLAVDTCLNVWEELKLADGDMTPQVRIFSDTVVVAIPGQPSGGLAMLGLLALNLCALSVSGFFVRGAIVRGRHYDDGQILISPALIRAYDMERSEAFHPRVLVSDEVRADFATYRATLGDGPANGSDLLWQDTDGRWFVNYLDWHSYFQKTEYAHAGLDLLQRHKAKLTWALQRWASEPAVLAKYSWLASYHNRYCRLHLQPEQEPHYLVQDVDDNAVTASPKTDVKPTGAQTRTTAATMRARAREMMSRARMDLLSHEDERPTTALQGFSAALPVGGKGIRELLDLEDKIEWRADDGPTDSADPTRRDAPR